MTELALEPICSSSASGHFSFVVCMHIHFESEWQLLQYYHGPYIFMQRLRVGEMTWDQFCLLDRNGWDYMDREDPPQALSSLSSDWLCMCVLWRGQMMLVINATCWTGKHVNVMQMLFFYIQYRLRFPFTRFCTVCVILSKSNVTCVQCPQPIHKGGRR